MILTIDSFDGAGPRDYTAALDGETRPKVVRRLNRPATATLALVATSADFVVPAAGGRIKLTRADGHNYFTGYLTAAPAHEYLGWGPGAPAYRYLLQTESDEWLLDRKRLPQRPAYTMRTAGAVLRQLTQDAAAGFDLSGIDDLETQPSYTASPQFRWSEHAASLALRTRAVVRAHDGKISFNALGTAGQLIDESAQAVSPERLLLQSPKKIANDVTVIGRAEPRAYVKNYFLGDGLTSSFSLSHVPFTRRVGAIADEEFKGAAPDPTLWTVLDPSAAISVSAGKLRVSGGTNTDGQTVLRCNELIQLAGSVRLQHGELEFSASSNAVVGGLYNGAVLQANCLAGFRVTAAAGVHSIQAVVNGSLTGPVITTVAGHRYALTTRAYCIEAYRQRQWFHSAVHGSGSGRGGTAITAQVRFVLEAHHIDPANPATLAAPATLLFDGVLSAAPGFCTYAPVNVLQADCTFTFIEVSRGADAEIRSTVPGYATRTRLVGNVADGAECSVSQYGGLRFFSPYVPVPNEAITVNIRSSGRAIARVQDAASIAANAFGADDGTRCAVLRTVQPAARDAIDCENAALAVLDDATQPAWAGSYQTISDFMPGGPAVDPVPGESWTVLAPSRNANFTAIVHGVELEVLNAGDERCHYKIDFANDAASGNSFEFAGGVLGELLDPVTPGVSFLADLPTAEITAITSTTVDIDSGVTPPAGGGIEVRRSDFGWSAESDRGLVGRFTTRTFTVPRLARVQTYCLRQFDSGTPRKYSRYTTVLYIDYPY